MLGQPGGGGLDRGTQAVAIVRVAIHASGTRYSAPTSVSNSSTDVSALGESNVMRPFCSRQTRPVVSDAVKALRSTQRIAAAPCAAPADQPMISQFFLAPIAASGSSSRMILASENTERATAMAWR